MMSHLQQVEHKIETLKARKAKAVKLTKLMNNREFKEIILDDYLAQEPVRLTTLLANSRTYENAVGELLAISRFSEYLRTLENLHADVDGEIEEAEEIRNQLMAEEE